MEDACLAGGAAYFTTSAKNADAVDTALKLIPQASETEYGRVWKLSSNNQASGHFRWPLAGGKTTLQFVANDTSLSIFQDGRRVAVTSFAAPLKPYDFGKLTASTGTGIFGPAAVNVQVQVSL